MRHNKTKILIAALAVAGAFAQGAARAAEGPPGQNGEAPLYYFCMAGLGTSNYFYVTPLMRETWKYDPLGIVLKQPVNYAWKQAVSKERLANNPHCEHGTKESAEKERATQIELVAHFKHKIVNMNWQYGQNGPATSAGAAPAPTGAALESKNTGDAKPAMNLAPAADETAPQH